MPPPTLDYCFGQPAPDEEEGGDAPPAGGGGPSGPAPEPTPTPSPSPSSGSQPRYDYEYEGGSGGGGDPDCINPCKLAEEVRLVKVSQQHVDKGLKAVFVFSEGRATTTGVAYKNGCCGEGWEVSGSMEEQTARSSRTRRTKEGNNIHVLWRASTASTNGNSVYRLPIRLRTGMTIGGSPTTGRAISSETRVIRPIQPSTKTVATT